MNIKIDSNAFTPLDKMVGLSRSEIELLEFKITDQQLIGDVKISGEYYTDDLEYEENNGLRNFENIIPFEVVFTKTPVELEKVEIKEFKYYEVAGRGVEASFIIDIEYTECLEDNTREKEEEKQLEIVKEGITEELDEVLSNILELKDDNFLEEEKRSNGIVLEPDNEKEKAQANKTIFKVLYYKDSDDIYDFCKKYDLSYDEVLLENKKYAYSNNHRIIINTSDGNN